MGNINHLGYLTERIKQTKAALVAGNGHALSVQTLEQGGLQKVKEEAFVRLSAKVQRYIDISLTLRDGHPMFDGLPPTELQDENGRLTPKPVGAIYRTAAIDQQRQLYAAARAALLDPAYGDEIMPQLIEWHDAFVRHFVIAGPNPRIRELITNPAASSPREPATQAHLRLTYAIQGSATLSRALYCAAERSSDQVRLEQYRAKSQDIRILVLGVGEQFVADYADRRRAGRYFLYPFGEHQNPALRGLSHNNSQSYLIEGMRALADLDPYKWRKRLEELLRFIETQRDPVTGLLHEFDFPAPNNGFPADAVRDAQHINWQSSEHDNEIVILGHTLAGIYAAQGKSIADAIGREQLKMSALVQGFVDTMNRLGGIHTNGLPANGFEIVLDGTRVFREMTNLKGEVWPEGTWQAELLWQFLFCADCCGADLASFKVECEGEMVSLDHLLARGLAFHDAYLFDGTSYVIENGNKLSGRDMAAPINHAADTLRDLADNLSRTVPFKYNFNLNEIKEYVHRLFGLYDRHADVSEILPLLAAHNLEMDFPDRRVRSQRDFIDWYEKVGGHVLWNVHRLERVDIGVVGHRIYQVDIALVWEGANAADGKPFAYAVDQTWRVIDADGSRLLIERYQVTRFESLPVPVQFNPPGAVK